MKRREFLYGAAAVGVLAGCSPITKATAPVVKATPKVTPSWMKDATAHGEMIASGEMSALEQANIAIGRAEKFNEKLNFVVTPTFEQAREVAQSDLPAGPFSGVPTMTKDLQETIGVRTAYGSRAFMNNIPDHDHRFVTAMKEAGLVSIGKAATPEFGFLPTTEPLAFGPTRNPWNTDHSTGGSSGGSACAVAAGVVPMAQSSDGGGSIRIPANCCGLFGMKASRGRWPDSDGTPWELTVKGFVSRTVRDSQTAMATMAATDKGLPAPVLPAEGEKKQYKIGYSTKDSWGNEVHPDCKKAVLMAAKTCADLGHVVEEAAPAYSAQAFNDAFMTLWSFGAKQVVGNVSKALGGKPVPPELLEPLTWWLYAKVADKEPSVLEDVYAQFAKERDASRAFHQTHDFYLSPVLGEPAVKIGRIDQSGDLDALGEWLKSYVPFTPYANATGHPAMSVPTLWTADNVPVGVQFEANFGNEANLFALASQIEEAAPWAHRWPELALA
jgi:amidase